MNDEVIGVLGQFCHELLEDPRFDALKQLFGQQMAADMLQTAPHEVKKREGIHAAYTGFLEFTALMQKFAEAYNALVREQLRAANPEPTDDPAAHNIYGFED